METGAEARRRVRTAREDYAMELSREYWEGYLRAHPIEATSIGDHRFDDRLRDNSPAAYATETSRLRDLRARVDMVDPEVLSPADRVTRTALRHLVGSDLVEVASGMETWNVDPMGGPQVEFMNVPALTRLTDPASGRAMVSRWRAMGPWLDRHVENLRRGLGAGRVAPAKAAERVIAQIDDLEKTPIEDWAVLSPLRLVPESWPEADREAFGRDLTAAAAEGLRPALFRYRDFLRGSVAPRARSDDRPGIMHVDGGTDLYLRLIRVHTSLDLSPEAIHRTGLAEVERLNDELRGLGDKVLGTSNLEDIHRRLREDPAMHFGTRDEVYAKAEEALRRAEAAVPNWFGIIPTAPCEVVRMEPHEEKHSTIAYYQHPSPDGSRPGMYYINTYAPETRPRYEAEALAFHEAVPGHHTQIAIAQELAGLPEFRRHRGVTAFIEGWGLYVERLADEMGLYSGDLDRIGVVSFDSWRAGRLVVDTGMHALGWTRQQAIDFMLANTVLAENNIVNEVDRYIAWPGQALAYKLGQLEILSLRAEAAARLGPRFEVKRFHDVVLGEGAVDLETLRRMVEGALK
jgi:uncharacterized protein (DUF885 family)